MVSTRMRYQRTVVPYLSETPFLNPDTSQGPIREPKDGGLGGQSAGR